MYPVYSVSSLQSLTHMSRSFTVRGLSKPTRLDRVLRNQFPEWGRQAVQKLISGRKVTVNGRSVWLASWEIGNGDVVTVLRRSADKAPGADEFCRRMVDCPGR